MCRIIKARTHCYLFSIISGQINYYSTHDAVITMDADLQHPPATIIDMIDLWQQGYE
jgi:hypothetical protein